MGITDVESKANSKSLAVRYDYTSQFQKRLPMLRGFSSATPVCFSS